MQDEDPKKWRNLSELKLSKKDLKKSIKKAHGATTRHARKFLTKRIDNMRLAKRHIIGWLTLVGVVVLAIGVQVYYSSKSYITEAPVVGGTYAEAVVGSIRTLNPLYASSEAELSAKKLIFSSLYDYDDRGFLRQDVASGFSVDETGKVYTVKIRDDVKWHDGAKLTAGDIVFTIGLIKNPAVRSSLNASWRDIAVVAVDEQTVRFTLPAAYAPFRHALTFAILPKHILKDVLPSVLRENTFSVAPVGSGPFSFQLLQTVDEDKQEKVVHLNGYNDYHRGAPRLSRFEIHGYDDIDDMKQALDSGEVNGASELIDPDMSRLGSQYSVKHAPLSRGAYLLFNLQDGLLSQIELRRALQLGTDTSALLKVIGNGVIALDTPFIKGQISGKEIVKPQYNLEGAAVLLDQAGWTMKGGVREKAGVPLNIAITTSKNALYSRVLDELKQQWAKLGVRVEARVIDESTGTVSLVSDVLRPRDYQVLIREMDIGADPDVYAYWHSSQAGSDGLNFSGYRNPLADDNLSSARSRLDANLRNIKYRTFINQWLSDVPAVGLYQPSISYVSHNKLTSFDQEINLPSAVDRYSNVIYWSVEKRPVYKTP
ncbi:MAG: peptide ABC transporter substrate-binding protein [Candidatus Saccharimonadaceae bacterium]